MATPIWKFEDYVRFASHPNPMVRRWAQDRLGKLYGEEAIEPMARLLNDTDETIASFAAIFLGDIGAKEYAFPLLRRFRESRGTVASNCAMALGKLSYAEAIPSLCDRLKVRHDTNEFLGVVNALGQIKEEKARRFLLQLLDTGPQRDYLISSVYRALLNFGDPSLIPHLVERYLDLPQQRENRVLKEFGQVTRSDELWDHFQHRCKGNFAEMIRAAEKEFAVPVAKLLSRDHRALLKRVFHRRKHYPDVVRIWPQAASAFLATQGQDWLSEGVPPLNDYQRHILTNLTFLNAFAQYSDQMGKREKETGTAEMTFLLSCFLEIGAARDYEKVLAEARVREEALSDVLREDRKDVPEEVMEELVASGPQVCGMLVDILKKDPHSWGAIRAAQALGRIAKNHPEACVEAVPALLDGLKSDKGDFLHEACKETLSHIGAPALPMIADVLGKTGDSSQKIYLTGTLEDIPLQESVDLLLENLEGLLVHCDELVLGALMNLGSAKAIEPLRQERQPGEYVLDEALFLLCEINGVQIPELEELREEVEEQEKRVKERKKLLESPGSLEDLFAEEEGEGMRLKLRCLECRREYTYDVGTVYHDADALERKSEKGEDNFFFEKQVVCKKCGAVDRYELTGEAFMALIAEQLKIVALARERGQAVEGTSKLQFVQFGLRDGTKMSPRQALAMYQQKVAQQPEQADLRVRYGNVLRFMKRKDEALAQYSKAFEMAPRSIEACYNLATLYEERGELAKSRRMFEKVLELVPLNLVDRKMNRQFAISAQQGLAHLDRRERRRMGPKASTERKPPKRKEIRPPTVVAKGEKAKRKIGRNDPCPCGSGRKYKHCCLGRRKGHK